MFSHFDNIVTYREPATGSFSCILWHKKYPGGFRYLNLFRIFLLLLYYYCFNFTILSVAITGFIYNIYFSVFSSSSSSNVFTVSSSFSGLEIFTL